MKVLMIRYVSLCSDLLGMVIADGKYMDLFAGLCVQSEAQYKPYVPLKGRIRAV